VEGGALLLGKSEANSIHDNRHIAFLNVGFHGVNAAGWLGSICRDFGLKCSRESDRQIAPSTATIAQGCLLGADCRWWP
jgi:hypothetical protein